MSGFRPFAGMLLQIGPVLCQFVPHPLFLDEQNEVFVVEGGEALLYQVRDVSSGAFYAFKVMKPAYQCEHIAAAADVLARCRDIPGLYLGRRICLSKARYPELITQFPALEYAVLMPWIEGQTWAGLMCNPAASQCYTTARARTLALATAQVLWDLETRHFAHTDIAGSNIILSPDFKQVQLVDIEGMYIAGIPAPKRYSLGSPGYQHRCLDQRGQWRPDGDRFAGAILLTEMLTWWEPYVRAQTPDDAESLFQPQELQVMKTPRWQAVRDVLWSISPAALQLFDQAWASHNLAECPDFATWTLCLIAAFK
ncbi:MAG TPA: serine/threonine-protein kinase [Ktedonobacteraceae bacterium]|nr:serine/threonine-protein kinase [Ktedonobacteraceae bacterium]